MSSPLSVSSSMASSGLQHGHLEDFVLLLFAAREAFVHGTARQLAVEFHHLSLLAHQFQELARRERRQAEVLAAAGHGELHEVSHAHPRYLHRVLEPEEYPRTGTLLDIHLQQVLSVILRRTGRHFETRAAGYHRSERALAGTVRSHDGVYFAGIHREVDAAQYLLALYRGMEASNRQYVFHTSIVVSILHSPHSAHRTKISHTGPNGPANPACRSSSSHRSSCQEQARTRTAKAR